MKQEPLDDMMVDLETFGSKSFSVIISICAINCNLKTGAIGKIFKRNISLDSCLSAGLKIQAETLLWWLNQKPKTLKSCLENSIPLKQALMEFDNYFCSLENPQIKIWGNSNKFDLGLLENAYDSVGLIKPWMFRKERDMRTLISDHEEIKSNHVYTGDLHDPVHDCLNQIQICHKVYKSLKK